METPKEYHYTYYSYEEWGRGYFGSRTCRCLPEEDVKYFGSFSDKNFKPTQKIILKSDYAARREAIVDEIILHNRYDVANNPHFANKSKQTSSKFDTTGTTSWRKGITGKYTAWNKGLTIEDERVQKYISKLKGKKRSKETNRNISQALKNLGDKHPSRNSERRRHQSQILKGRVSSNKGKSHSEETKNRMSDSHCNKIYTIISPIGQVFVVKNLNKFSIKNRLDSSGMYRVAKGKQKTYKGWVVTLYGLSQGTSQMHPNAL
jgi:hypothetical protein